MDRQLEWRMEVEGDTLRVHYTIRNSGDSPIWVVDDILVRDGSSFKRSPRYLIVRPGESPDTVSLYRGHHEIPLRRVSNKPRFHPPGVREIVAGGELAGEAETPLPLAARHNYHTRRMPALPAPPSRAVLEVQMLTAAGSDADWETVTLGDGSTLRSPHLRFLDAHSTIWRAGPQPIPDAAARPR